MSIETDIFPVDGNTLRRWTFQDASGGAVDDSVNAEPLDVITGTPTYQQQGYGDAVKSDGNDDGIQLITDNLGETNANSTHQNISNMTIEFICKHAVWNALNTWYGMFDCATTTFVNGGFAVYGVRNDTGQRFLVSDQTNTAYKYATVSEAAFGPTNGDWVYLCGVYDNAQTGDDKVQIYAGNLTSPTANVISKTSTSDDATGFVAMTAISKQLLCGQAYTGGVTQVLNMTISSGRIQGVAFSPATVEQRYDDIKAWVAAGGLLRISNLSGGMQELSGGIHG